MISRDGQVRGVNQKSKKKNSKTNNRMLLWCSLEPLAALVAILQVLQVAYAISPQQPQAPIVMPAAAPLPPVAAPSIQGLQQSMAQMLQVFNGNDSQHSEANHFKILERDGDFLLVGARNVVYNLSLSTMREQRRLEWPSSEDDVKMCRVKGKSPDQCQNYIRVLKLEAPDTLFVCGTNSYKPRCRTYLITSNAYELISEMPGEGACPYQENQNVTSLFAGGELYSATAAQFSGIDGLIHRAPLRTEQFNPKQLNSPNFVSSFRYGEHVYFLFREIAIEHINCGKAIYSRIARVCLNDSGGPSRASRERWTTFVKARLNCSIPGEFPFYFDEIQASTQIVSSPMASGGSQQAKANTDLLYAVFTTPTNSIGGSAVCAYRMSDVLAAFDGPFKAQADSNSNWLPVPESRVPQPRPGTCVNDTRQLLDEKINFIKDNPLMDMAVESVWSQPLVMMASINFRFTQIVVDSQVESQMAPGASAMRTDVIFVSTDDGRVLKLINTHHLMMGPATAQRNSQLLAPQQAGLMAGPQKPTREPLPDVSSGTIVIEELHLFDSRTPIVGMLLYYPPLIMSDLNLASSPGLYPKLVIVSGKQLKAVPLSRCERALSCADCLALYDPYCAWDIRHQVCLSVGRSMASSNSHSLSQHPFLPRSSWFPPNNLANNHTLGWWAQCPLNQLGGPEAGSQQVGAPYRSLFSSHLQVPSRFDYASGHHLSHTALVSLNQPQQQPQAAGGGPAASHYRQPPQPVSECLTFCGGLYTPLLTASASTSEPQQQQQGQQQQMMINCADYVQQHYIGGSNLQATGGGGGGGGGGGPGLPGQQQLASLYTSENLYLAVIICAASGLILGLVFGFAIGRNTRKHDSSICSSTFDETNLYMASTGSHHGPNMFGQHHHHPLHHHQRLLQQTPGTNELINGGGGGVNSNNGGLGTSLVDQHLFEANLMRDSAANYGNQQQLLLHLTNQQQQQHQGQMGAGGSIRTGQLPPLPQQAPLVNTSTSTTHINHSQLTPNSANGSSSASSTNTSSTSATVPANDHHHQHQLYLNKQQQQQIAAQQHSLHQRTFTNSSTNSNTTNCNNSKGSVGKLSSSNGKTPQTFLQQQQTQLQLQQQQQQQQQIQPQQHNKIYL